MNLKANWRATQVLINSTGPLRSAASEALLLYGPRLESLDSTREEYRVLVNLRRALEEYSQAAVALNATIAD